MKAVRLLLFAGFLFGVVSAARAGIYSTDEPFLFQLDAKGNAVALPFNDFRLLLVDWNGLFSASGEKQRKRVEDRLAKLSEVPDGKRTQEEIADLTYDQIRLRKIEAAMTMLQGVARSRDRDGFFVQAHLAFCHYERQEYREAYEHQFAALRDHPAPKKFGKLTPEQLTWLRRVEKDYFQPLLKMRRDEKNTGVPQKTDALFATMPPDAIAVVQQMLWWNPGDTRLYWLLGELYIEAGDKAAALRIFDECVDAPRNYSSKGLMERRHALREAQAEEAEKVRVADAARMEQEQGLKRQISYGAGALVLLFFFVFIRNTIRRIRR